MPNIDNNNNNRRIENLVTRPKTKFSNSGFQNNPNNFNNISIMNNNNNNINNIINRDNVNNIVPNIDNVNNIENINDLENHSDDDDADEVIGEENLPVTANILSGVTAMQRTVINRIYDRLSVGSLTTMSYSLENWVINLTNKNQPVLSSSFSNAINKMSGRRNLVRKNCDLRAGRNAPSSFTIGRELFEEIRVSRL